MYVHLSACTSAALTGRIAVRFHTGDFNENRRNTPNLAKIGHFTRRPKYVLLLLPTLNVRRALSSSDTVSGLTSDRPQRGPHKTNFPKIYIGGFHENLSRKCKFRYNWKKYQALYTNT